MDSVRQFVYLIAASMIRCVKQLSKPTTGFVATDLALDIAPPKRELVAENALLRHQLIILKRGERHPKLSNWDRLNLLFWARLTSS